MGLNEESQDTAYVLGRLFSVLESIQMEANPELRRRSGIGILIRRAQRLHPSFRFLSN